MSSRTRLITFFAVAPLIYGGLAGVLLADPAARERVEGWGVPLGLSSDSSPVADKQDETDTSEEVTKPPPVPLILYELDLYAAHPDDPALPKDLLPKNLPAATDDEVRALSAARVKKFLAGTTQISAARSQNHKARYLFQIGRVALLHKKDAIAKTLLTQAANAGSAPAHAYLAKLYADDPEKAKLHLKRAIELDFKPAEDALAQLNHRREE